jgi:hypothetical protein
VLTILPINPPVVSLFPKTLPYASVLEIFITPELFIVTDSTEPIAPPTKLEPLTEPVEIAPLIIPLIPILPAIPPTKFTPAQ